MQSVEISEIMISSKIAKKQGCKRSVMKLVNAYRRATADGMLQFIKRLKDVHGLHK